MGTATVTLTLPPNAFMLTRLQAPRPDPAPYAPFPATAKPDALAMTRKAAAGWTWACPCGTPARRTTATRAHARRLARKHLQDTHGIQGA